MSCVSELRQCAVAVRTGCAQTVGGCMQTMCRKCAENAVQERDSEGQAENVRLRAGGADTD